MKWIENFKQDLALRRQVAELDLSSGMTDAPSLTAFDGDDPRLGKYLGGLRRVQETIKDAAGSPEQVFLGDINLGRQSNLLVLFRQENEDRRTPPRQTFGVELPTVDAIDTGIAVRHLTQLAAANLGIAPEDQAPLVNQVTKTLKKNDGILAEVEVTPKWKFGVWVNNYGKTVTPRLMPVGQEEYSKHWVDRQTGLVEQSIRPDALIKTVMAAAASNFTVKEAEVAKVDEIDIGGLSGAHELITKQGYRTSSFEIYQPPDSKPEDANAHLRVFTSLPRMREIHFSAIPSRALIEKIRDEYHKRKLVPAAQEIIQARIQKAGNGIADGQVDLSPASIALEALDKTGQTGLAAAERESQLNLLSATVAKVLITRFRHHQEARPVAERLELFLAMSNDNSTITHHPKAVIEFGYRPKNDKFLFPVEWFTKK